MPRHSIPGRIIAVRSPIRNEFPVRSISNQLIRIPSTTAQFVRSEPPKVPEEDKKGQVEATSQSSLPAPGGIKVVSGQLATSMVSRF